MNIHQDFKDLPYDISYNATIDNTTPVYTYKDYSEVSIKESLDNIRDVIIATDVTICRDYSNEDLADKVINYIKQLNSSNKTI